jgi:hypothetical protein
LVTVATAAVLLVIAAGEARSECPVASALPQDGHCITSDLGSGALIFDEPLRQQHEQREKLKHREKLLAAARSRQRAMVFKEFLLRRAQDNLSGGPPK